MNDAAWNSMSAQGYSLNSVRDALTFTTELSLPQAHVSNEDGAVIAPWTTDDDPSPSIPPLKSQRSLGLRRKTSFSSFAFTSAVNLLAPRGGRPSEAQSITESSTSNHSDPTKPQPQHVLRKSKSSMFSNLLKRSRSKPRLRADSGLDLVVTQTSPSYASGILPFLPISGPPSPTFPITKKDKIRGKKKSSARPPPLPPKDRPVEPEIKLDTNIDDMKGIVSLSILSATQDSSTPGSGLDDNQSSGISHSDGFPASPTSSIFSNPFPFLPSSVTVIRPYTLDQRKVSPKTILPASGPISSADASWIAPESWSVEREGEKLDEPGYSSTDSSVGGGGGRPSSMSLGYQKRKFRRKTMKPSKPPLVGYQAYKVRIFGDGNFHVAAIGLSVTVEDLGPVLDQRLLKDKDRESHRLYLKERGRERILAHTERPADIARRRLEQCGYEENDGLETLASGDLSFLFKFVYKSQSLGQAEEELSLDNYEHVDLRGRSMRTIPVALHTMADCIVTLNLSRNPILEIPLDFIQSCVTLRELRLSNMAMKKVPQSVRHSGTLQRLDLSCNRIVDLDEAGLDLIPELTYLSLQNNRMEKLPWYFPRMRSLRYLNISNNKLRKLPSVITEVAGLLDLDISFNAISELPDNIGQLKTLEKFIIVGNQVSRLPDEFTGLINLRILDCRRNQITDLSLTSKLPSLEKLYADHNAVHALDLGLGSCLKILNVSHNDITQLTVPPGFVGSNPYVLTSLDLSHAKLSSLDNIALGQLSSLQYLNLDHNSFRTIPESLGELSQLIHLSCSDNHIGALPASIGRLQKLQILDVHNNSLKELPVGLWNCASLTQINVTSNLVRSWPDPPLVTLYTPLYSSFAESTSLAPPPVPAKEPGTADRKASATGSIGMELLPPPLASSLQRLYLGENRVTDEYLHPLMILKELRVLNLSFNDLQDMPSNFFKNLVKLEEVYLSGNKLSNIPTEDLQRLKRLSVLFLNGNRLQTLPHELGKVQSLTVLDVGSNILKYNINNWEFDWNWNFNPNLKYLNFSGNQRLEIKLDTVSQKVQMDYEHNSRKVLADFSTLTQLRVLGLIDVTTTFAHNIPDESENRRVRTSSSVVNKMGYGIADHLGNDDCLKMLDLVQPEFMDKRDDAVFALFGRTQQFSNHNLLTQYLHDNFLSVFAGQLSALDKNKNEGVPDALRRSFLVLNRHLYDELCTGAYMNRKLSQTSGSMVGKSLGVEGSWLRSGASGIVLYLADQTLYVANAGDALAVISRQGSAHPLAVKHDPFDRSETARIRSAEGWVSPKGLVNDEIDVSRSFGFYHLLPVVNARPDICTWTLSESDEFVIVANRGLWDYVSFQTAVDIARSEQCPMIAAQKLRDFAISYGSVECTTIMVINVGDLFHYRPNPHRQDSLIEPEIYSSLNKVRRRKDNNISDRNISRLDDEVSPPTDHLALVFTDIRNSTHLWEANAGMPSAMRLHNNLLRRQLRLCGGYEVKTEGDAFMCSFPTTLSALSWCLTVQMQLVNEPWPLEILECDDGREVYDSKGNLVARGLSVRMGIHCGMPLCEPDPITGRMDYFGSMVNRSARITGSASGGQIMCSADVIREINARIFETESWTEYSEYQPLQAINAIRQIGVTVVLVGHVKLKGLEIPEMLSLVYPTELAGRQELDASETEPSASGSRVQYSVEQIRDLGMLCLRIEALSTGRVFRPFPERKKSSQKSILGSQPEETAERNDTQLESRYMYGDPKLLLPNLSDRASDKDLMAVLDSLSVRIENAITSVASRYVPKRCNVENAISTLQQRAGLDEEVLERVAAILRSMKT